MGPANPSIPRSHERPAEGETNELLGFQRVLFWVRVVGALVVVSQAPAHPLIWVVVAIAGITAAAGWWTMRAATALAELRRRGVLFLVADLVAVYLMGAALTPDEPWLAFYVYPLLSLEATLIAGTIAGLLLTGLSLVVYGAQVAMHVSFGHDVDPSEVIAAVGLVGLTGGSMTAFGLLADRGRRDLRILLDLTSSLAHRRDEMDTIELLDGRLHDAVGGRVRALALRGPEGEFRVLSWHSSERHPLETRPIEDGLGDLDAVALRFRAGTSLTYQTDAWSVITTSLGLPEWARAVTLVPIFLEDEWVGVLPVLWPSPKTPNRHELRLLYGIANQVGLALAQGQLQRVREEAATDPLTRLLNRRAISDELASFVARATRGEETMALLFCDLDDFKAVNDRHGHEAGDVVLQAVAAAVRSALRAGDVVGRYGGDELLVVAAGADADDAVALARRVREAVCAAASKDGVDMTIGSAVFPADGRTDAELMLAADQAMYRGKLRGPGQVVVGSEEDPRPEAGAGEAAGPEGAAGEPDSRRDTEPGEPLG